MAWQVKNLTDIHGDANFIKILCILKKKKKKKKMSFWSIAQSVQIYCYNP